MEFLRLWPALAGGALIGVASLLVLVLDGRVLGLSGVMGGLIGRPDQDTSWRLSLVAGLATGGLLLAWLAPATVDVRLEASTGTLVLAGLCVGFGTRMGNGCTSGHGVCGIGRMSVRSLIATLTFITTGVITVLVSRGLGTL
jgi:uncharacterized protein